MNISPEAREAYKAIVQQNDLDLAAHNLEREKEGREVFLLPIDLQLAINSATEKLEKENRRLTSLTLAVVELQQQNQQLREELELYKKENLRVEELNVDAETAILGLREELKLVRIYESTNEELQTTVLGLREALEELYDKAKKNQREVDSRVFDEALAAARKELEKEPS